MKNLNNNTAEQIKFAPHQKSCEQGKKFHVKQVLTAQNEDSPTYNLGANEEEIIIAKALEILANRMRKAGECLNSPLSVRNFLSLKLAEKEHEVFAAIFLDAQHQVVEYNELFRGTLTQTSVYPREVVKRALALNCAAVIFAHNHPSGVDTPSQSDRLLTDALKQALGLVDVRVLDHFIVAGTSTLSFAERGYL
jgi:DNA repair protein RadC